MYRAFEYPARSAPEASSPELYVSWTASRVWLLWLIGTAVASAPLFVAPLPPLAQHFYNLARVEILANPAAYAKYFVIRWDAIPDLAMDLVVPWMARLISVEQAAWIFLFATLALLTSGSLVLGRIVNGRWSALPLLSFLFLYNWILIRGYENNLFGLGLTLWALAVHISLRRSAAMRVVVSSFSAVAIYLCHLFPLGVFALVIGTWELGCLLQERLTARRVLGHAAASLAPFLVPAFLLLHSSTGGLGGGVELALFNVWARIKLCISALTIGNRTADVTLLVGVSLAALLATGRGWLTCKPECRVAVIALPLVAVVFAPLSAFASFGIIERCAVAFAFLLPALLQLRSVDLGFQRLVAGALVLVFLIRIGTVSADWHAAETMTDAYRAAFAALEPGSVMFQFSEDIEFPPPLMEPDRWNPRLDKIVALAILNGVLVPELHLKEGQQPVLYRAEYEPLRAFQYEADYRQIRFAGDALLHGWLAELSQRFPDLRSRFTAVYVAVYDPSRRLAESLPGAKLVAVLPQHRLYKLAPP